MPVRVEPVSVSIATIRAVRWSVDGLHVGVKDRVTTARVEAGRSTWGSRGVTWNVTPGSLIVQAPGDVCRDLARPEPGVCQVITFDATLTDGPTSTRQHPPHLADGDPRGAALHALHDAVTAQADAFTLEVAVAEAIDSLAAITGRESYGTRAVRRAMTFLHERYAEPLRLDEIASYAGLDKYRLCRAFRAEVGLAPHAYLVRVRVGRAKELLRAGTRPAEVAPRVGFYDQSQLHRHFRRIVGTTPAQYARA